MVHGAFLDLCKLPDPGIHVQGKILFQKTLEDLPCIPHQRDRGTEVFPDLSRIDVNVDDVYLFFQVLGPGNGPVRDPGSHDDQKIAGGYGPVGIGLSVVPQHSKI